MSVRKRSTKRAVIGLVLALTQMGNMTCFAEGNDNFKEVNFGRPEIISIEDNSILTEDTEIVWTDISGTFAYRVTLSDENGVVKSFDTDTNSFIITKDNVNVDKVYEIKVTNLYGPSFLLSGEEVKFKYVNSTDDLTGAKGYDTLYNEEKPLILGNVTNTVPFLVSKKKSDLPTMTKEEYFVVDKALSSVGKSISDVEFLNDKVEAQEESLSISESVVKAGISDEVKWARIFPDGHRYSSASEAAPHLKVVQIPAWNLDSNGNKYATTYNLQVHEALADEVVEIFVEIFNDPEQFPIKCIGGWRWSYLRSGAPSQHNYGTCIDINPDENYMIRADGSIEYPGVWEPYTNPYSITPDGSVMRAFRKRGWGWGGADWKSSRDYMHLTYLGG